MTQVLFQYLTVHCCREPTARFTSTGNPRPFALCTNDIRLKGNAKGLKNCLRSYTCELLHIILFNVFLYIYSSSRGVLSMHSLVQNFWPVIMVPMSITTHNHLGTVSVSLVLTQGGPAHFCPQARIGKFCILAPEGRRDSNFSLKWPQWPHLYKSYEATYGLKCLFFEKIVNNLISGSCAFENQFFTIFSKSKHFRA